MFDGRLRPKKIMIGLMSAAVALVMSAALASAQPPAPDASPAPAGVDRIYMEGRLDFQEGRDEAAADLLMQAARLDWHCVAMVRDIRYQTLLAAQPCAEVPALHYPEKLVDPGPEMLYRLGMIRKAAAREQKQDEVLVRRQGEYFLQRLVREYGSSAWADDAALVLAEDGSCMVDGGYPSCVEWRIQGYEQWLSRYGASELRPGVMEKLAESYLELARRYDEPEPWQAPVSAELCRGRALQISRELPREFPGTDATRWGQELAQKIQASGKPYSMVPQGLTQQ